MDEPRHGRDYLIDFYALLEIPRDADDAVIHQAYRDKARAYHTDQYQHLAPELKAQADFTMQILNQAKEILFNPQKKASYDKQLADWQGLISTDGRPIISLDGPSFSSIPLLTESPEDSEFLKKKKEFIAQLSGHDESIFRFIEHTYQSTENPPQELEAAYREALRKRDLYLALETQILWEKVGYARRPIEGQLPYHYAESIERELREAREKILGDLGGKLALIQRGELKALAPGGEELTQSLAQDPEGTAARYQKEVGKRFDARAKDILEAARERETLIEKRLEAIEWSYWPEQKEIFDHLLVKVQVGENFCWLAFALAGDEHTAKTDETIKSHLPAQDISEEEARCFIEQGYNIIRMIAEDNIKIFEQVKIVVLKHFEKYQKPSH